MPLGAVRARPPESGCWVSPLLGQQSAASCAPPIKAVHLQAPRCIVAPVPGPGLPCGIWRVARQALGRQHPRSRLRPKWGPTCRPGLPGAGGAQSWRALHCRLHLGRLKHRQVSLLSFLEDSVVLGVLWGWAGSGWARDGLILTSSCERSRGALVACAFSGFLCTWVSAFLLTSACWLRFGG